VITGESFKLMEKRMEVYFNTARNVDQKLNNIP